MPFRPGSWIALLAVVAALAVAPGAAAQQAPRLGAPAPPDTIQATTTSTSSGGGGLKTWQEALIFAAGLILIGGIAVAIMTDARERAGRIRHGDAATEPAAGAGHPPRQQGKQRARAKAQAARAQRRQK